MKNHADEGSRMTEPATNRYDAMQYRYAGRSGLKLPAISLGAWETFAQALLFSNEASYVN